MKSYTAIEQSKKLIELGLDSDTADMCYPYNPYMPTLYYDIPSVREGVPKDDNDISCWSLAALLELMPKNFTLSKEDVFSIEPPEKLPNKWCCEVENLNGTSLGHVTIKDSPIKATFEMFCWLLENNYIETKNKK